MKVRLIQRINGRYEFQSYDNEHKQWRDHNYIMFSTRNQAIPYLADFVNHIKSSEICHIEAEWTVDE